MVEFKERTSPAALSYAAVTSEPKEQPEPDQIWKPREKNQQLESENRLLWRLIWLFWVCWMISLVATVWMADKL